MSRIVANKTLGTKVSRNKGHRQEITLLRVIGRVSEEPWIDTALNPISAFDDYTVLECIYKRIVEEEVPHSMDQFTMTVRQDVLLLCVPLLVKCCRKVTKVVRELRGV